MPANDFAYRIALSGTGAVLLAALGGVVGLAWAQALDAPGWAAAVLAAIAAVWGAIVVHLTPTGGKITENRTTVNYAVFALHAWYAAFLCIAALAILAIRAWVV